MTDDLNAFVEALDENNILADDTYEFIMSIPDPLERKKLIIAISMKANKFKLKREFLELLKSNFMDRAKQFQQQNKGRTTNFINQPLQLNCGEWQADDGGVKHEEMAQGGDFICRYASPIPILPTEILVNVDTNIEKMRLEFKKNGAWNNIVVERSKVANNGKIVDLADCGVEVNSDNAKLLVKYIADCVALNLDELPRHKAVSHLGWCENQFMPYDPDIKFDGEKENKYLFEAVSQAGDYTDWISYTHELRKNIFLRMQMAASFASPIIEKIAALPFVLHLWGGSGSGKTVGLMVAMSIWGNPRMGRMTRTMNMTANSMLSTAAFLRNIPFAGDELQTIKNKWDSYDNLIMKVTEGVERGRMSYDKNNEMRAWYTAFLFTGEEPCTKSGSGGGVINRVIEIECTDKVVAKGNETVNFVNKHYGHAGINFISAIRNEDLLKQYTEIFNEILSLNITTDKQASSMALMLLADKLACKYIYTNEQPLMICEVEKYLTSTKAVDVSERAYEFIVNMIAQNANRFKSAENNNGEIWGKIDEYDDTVLINKDVLCEKMTAGGFEFDAVKRKWAEKEYLIKNSMGRYIHQTHCFNAKGNYIKLQLPDFRDELDTSEDPFSD